MRYDVKAKQIKHYADSKEIVFEQLLSEAEHAHIAALQAGKDLWKVDPLLKKIVLGRRIGDILYELTEKKPVRLIFDEVAPSFLIDMKALPIQGMLAAIIFDQTENIAKIIDSSKTIEIEVPSYIALYAENSAQFIENGLTPFAYDLKKRGYVYGDRLKNEDFPFVR